MPRTLSTAKKKEKQSSTRGWTRLAAASGPSTRATRWKPDRAQKRGVAWLLEHACAGLFLDPGLGKTSITLAAFSILKSEGVSSRMLVVAPRRVCHKVWPVEVQKWEEFKHLKVHVLRGDGRTDAALRDKSIDVYCINPEGLDWLLRSPGRLKWLDCDILCVDESSKFRNTQSVRFKKLKKHLRRFRRRYILTGSPAPNGLLDLFGQVFIMDTGHALGRYITHYRNAYFDSTGFGGFSWKLREGAEEQIYAKLRPYVLVLNAEDYMDLPQEVLVPVKVELDAKSRRAYDDMEEEMFSLLDSGAKISAVTSAVVQMKCRQIANGAVYFDEEAEYDLAPDGALIPRKKRRAGRREFHLLHDLKLDALEEYLAERNGRPTLVIYEFKHDLERILDRLGKDTPFLGGGVSDKRADAICDAWNADELPLLLGHPASMGHGLNLQSGSADAIIWYTPTWDWELYDQTNRRLRRRGSKNKRIYIGHLIAEDTVDEVAFAVCRAKGSREGKLKAALNSYRRRRNV